MGKEHEHRDINQDMMKLSKELHEKSSYVSNQMKELIEEMEQVLAKTAEPYEKKLKELGAEASKLTQQGNDVHLAAITLRKCKGDCYEKESKAILRNQA
jgi:ElaB/YqjD/DUF883 family membrane-anchored ribosome-binding protein